MSIDTPEMDAIRRIRPHAYTIYGFLDWLRNETSFYICDAESGTPCSLNNEELVALYFDIDLFRAEDERCKLEAYIADTMLGEH